MKFGIGDGVLIINKSRGAFRGYIDSVDIVNSRVVIRITDSYIHNRSIFAPGQRIVVDEKDKDNKIYKFRNKHNIFKVIFDIKGR